ncbi:MAG: preprotein translocase subunit SecA [Phycisphaerae bacterium]|nr:preprotein translocase subunit SecA [Phycisphaerae bacterium]
MGRPRHTKKYFGTGRLRAWKTRRQVGDVVGEAGAIESGVCELSDARLRERADELRGQIREGRPLADALCDGFALIRESARRNVGLRHFDVQMMGGLVMSRGGIAEMATGEGKTLVATLWASLAGLTGRGVHVVTVNDYLAKRDREWMGKVYEGLGLTVGVVVEGMEPPERKEAYARDVTYGTNKEFGFDYLRDQLGRMSRRSRLGKSVRDSLLGVTEPVGREAVQRGHAFAIVDEVDSVLIDEARVPLIIASAPGECEEADVYRCADDVAAQLEAGRDFKPDEKRRGVELTDRGRQRIYDLLPPKVKSWASERPWSQCVEQAVKAQRYWKRDRDYIIVDGKLVIVDEFTGRQQPDRTWSDGLHQAIEARERLEIRAEHQTLAQITFQRYFRLYDHLCGMTGTAATSAREFWTIYGLPVVQVPTNRPLRRTRMPDRVYASVEAKFDAIEAAIVEHHRQGRPVLVGTRNVAANEIVSERLRRSGLEHAVLNAKEHEKEAQIVAQAGQAGRITIATNMAGRGTDIVLGSGVADVGGLHVIGTERHDARRIDLQLVGRSGRQGDPGSGQFFLSLEDELIQLHGPRWARRAAARRAADPLSGQRWIGMFDSTQQRLERLHLQIRRDLMVHDDWMEKALRRLAGQHVE